MSSPRNPDTRPLPAGWIEQYDPHHKTWFYVDTRATPPTSSWTHPALQVPPQYAPPSAPAGGYPQQGGYGGQGGYGPAHLDRSSSATSSAREGYGQGPYNQGPGWQQGPPQGNWQPQSAQGGYPQGSGGYGGGYGGYQQGPGDQRGWFGGSSHQQQQQQPQYQQAQPKKSGFGVGTLALGAGGGLLAGALLEHEFDESREDAYDAGYANGADGGDYGGGDFGGDF